ncbi:MAG: hypothetical protein ACI870_000108 [Crocinitomicaceae bacterium]|jgi:hypothetical protein
MKNTFLDKKNYGKLYIKQAGEDRDTLWKSVLGLIIVTVVISVLINVVLGLTFGESWLVRIITQLIGFFVSLYTIKFVLNLVDTGKASFKDTLSSFTSRQVLYALGAYILMILAVITGLILLIIPGIIWSYMFMLVIYLGADGVIRPVNAMKESRRLTAGYKMKIFITIAWVHTYFLVIPLVAFLFMLLAQGLAWPSVIITFFSAAVLAFAIYAYFALVTLLPRMYRDLQNIQGENIEASDEIIGREEVLDRD